MQLCESNEGENTMENMDDRDYSKSWQSSQASAPSPAGHPSQDPPGKSAAITSMILGIISAVFVFFGRGGIASAILGIIGLIYAKNAKKAGYEDVTETIGFVLSLVGLIVGGIAFVVNCLALIRVFAATARLAAVI